jgi:tRNA dimethylallyltransferase
LEAEAARAGPRALHARLAEVDSDAAARLDYRNVRRVVRALEVYSKTGIPISQHQGAQPPPYCTLQVGLTMPRELLYARADARVDRMVDKGLVAEVKTLMDQGYDLNLPAMSGLGYRQVGAYLVGELDLEEAIHLIKKETHRFIRQQYNWFRLDDPSIHWFDTNGEFFAALYNLVDRFLVEGDSDD